MRVEFTFRTCFRAYILPMLYVGTEISKCVCHVAVMVWAAEVFLRFAGSLQFCGLDCIDFGVAATVEFRVVLGLIVAQPYSPNIIRNKFTMCT